MINNDPLRNTPVPTVEEHYHVRDLIARQEVRARDRQQHKDRIKAQEERHGDLRDAKLFIITDFHCDQCNKDFKNIATLQVETDWTCSEQFIAFYKTKHRRCGTWSIRFVTDKHKDGFFIKSQAVRIDQGRHFADLVQPHETGFNLLYGKRN